jgi:hypothetical protein
LFEWCSIELANDDAFVQTVDAAGFLLWQQCLDYRQLANFESVLLFCYLQKRLRDEPLPPTIAMSLGGHQAAFAKLAFDRKNFYECTPCPCENDHRRQFIV